MNERIERLMPEPWVWPLDKQYFTKKQMEEIALSVIRECIVTIQNIKPQYGDYRDQIENAQSAYCIEQIKKRFGIEE